MEETEDDLSRLLSVIVSQGKLVLIGLLLVLVPVVLVGQALEKAYKVVRNGLESVAPQIKALSGIDLPITIVLALFGACWLLGFLATRTGVGRRLREWEKEKFGRSPLLKNVQRFTAKRTTSASEASPAVHPALARIAGDWQPGVVVEEQDGGWATVFVPQIPNVAMGRLYCLPDDQILRLAMPLDEFKKKLTASGYGSRDWLQALANQT